MNWEILPSPKGWRVWSRTRQLNIVEDVSWELAFTIKRNLERNAPRRADAIAGGL